MAAVPAEPAGANLRPRREPNLCRWNFAHAPSNGGFVLAVNAYVLPSDGCTGALSTQRGGFPTHDQHQWLELSTGGGLADVAGFCISLFLTGINGSTVTFPVEPGRHSNFWSYGSLLASNCL
jgi:hypothetical protein